MSTVTQAVVLTAGQGTRLRPMTNDRPKPMIEIGGRPLVEHTVLQLVASGVERIIMNLHHCPDVVRQHFGDGRRHGVQIEYSLEPELLGTAGAVKRLAPTLAARPFFVVYGDNLTTCDFGRLAEAHAGGGATATIALFWKEDVTPHSAVELATGDRIIRFVEKPKAEEAPSHWISAGMNIMEPAVLACIPDDRPADFGFDVFPRLLREHHRIQGYLMGAKEGLWWIDTPEHYARVAELWKNGAPSE